MNKDTGAEDLDLGLQLNVVKRLKCPGCSSRAGYTVHVHAVRWRCCGLVRILPPMAEQKKGWQAMQDGLKAWRQRAA